MRFGVCLGVCVCVCVYHLDVVGADDAPYIAEFPQQQVEDFRRSLLLVTTELLEMSQLPLHLHEPRLTHTHTHTRMTIQVPFVCINKNKNKCIVCVKHRTFIAQNKLTPFYEMSFQMSSQT